MFIVQRKDVVAVKSSVASLKRISGDFKTVADSLDSTEVAASMRQLTSPTSVNGTVRKVGIALAIAPEPFTTALGIVMVAGSYAMKSREPASLEDLAKASRAALGDLSDLSLDSLSLSF
jgi:hypothetical protein